MLWGIIICLGLLALIYAAFRKLSFFKDTQMPTSNLNVAFLIKLCGALALFLIYNLHYQDRSNSDVFKYYDDALVIYSHAEWEISELTDLFNNEVQRSEKVISILENTQHWDQDWHILPNDNRLMILLNLALLYISQGFYLFHLLCFAFLSFVGSIALFHFFSSLTTIPPKLLLTLLILPPSTLLWTSGMLKESVFFFAFGLLLFSIQKLKMERNWRLFAMLFLSAALSMWVKTYLLICFVPAILLYLASDRLKLQYNLMVTAFTLLAICLMLWWQLKSSLSEQLQRFTVLAKEIDANTYFPIKVREDMIDFLIGIPEAIYNVWIRPILMWDKGMLSLINAFESLGYLLLPFLLIPFYKHQKTNYLLFWMLLSFIVLLSIIIGSSIPVMGAVVRYRSPLIPFYLILLFTFVDINKLTQIFRKNGPQAS